MVHPTDVGNPTTVSSDLNAYSGTSTLRSFNITDLGIFMA